MSAERPIGPTVSPPREEIPSLPEVVRFLVRTRWWILGGALAAALGTALVIGLLLPPRYRSVATLVVAPPRLPGDLRPSELPVQGYERLLASDTVLAETRRRLVEEGVLEPDEELGVGGRLEVRLVVAERTETPLAPTLELVAHDDDPKAAAAIANAWAEAFLGLARDLAGESLVATGELAQEELGRATAEIARLQAALAALAEERGEELLGIQAVWDRRAARAAAAWEERIAERRAQTTERLAAYAEESRRLLEELARSEGAAAGVPASPLAEIVRLRARLAETPQVVVLAREQGPLGALQRAEELNPLHAETVVRADEAERKVLDGLAADGGTRAAAAERLLRRLERLQRERSAGYRALQEEGIDAIGDLRRQAAAEAATAERRRALALEAAERRYGSRQEALLRDLRASEELERRYVPNVLGARLAKTAEGFAEVRLGSAARPAPAPEPRGALPKAVAAAILGALLGLAAAVVRELARSPKPVAR